MLVKPLSPVCGCGAPTSVNSARPQSKPLHQSCRSDLQPGWKREASKRQKDICAKGHCFVNSKMLLFAWGSVGCSQVSCTEVPANPYVVTLAVAKMNNKYSLWAHPGGICDKDLNGAKTNASMKHFFIHLQWRLGCKSGKLAKSHLKCFWISLHLPRRKPHCQGSYKMIYDPVVTQLICL